MPANTRQAQNTRVQFRPRILALSVAACFTVAPAFALPTGGQVVAGSVKFNNQTPNSLVITNTPGAIINWSNFSVGAVESVKFQQQNSLSSVLNRVTGSTSSSIQGALLSNGRVFLINPNGILFGPNSKVDVNGLIASTLNISDEDFRKGKLNFQGGDNAGSIQNAGTLDAAKNIYLIGPEIENSGILRSAKGEVLLAAGRQVSLVDAAHPDIQVVISAPTDKAVNLGDIVAGKISLFGALVQHKGRANADRVEVDEKGRIVFRATKQLDLDVGSQTTANGPTGGSITLQTTEGDTYVKGDISATGKVGAGGTAQVLGQRVAVMDNAVIDASGETGGGMILVGGDYQGKNTAVQNSNATWFGPDASLKANANSNGNGGKVIVWADAATRAYGTIEAKGGSTQGKGGLIETSGRHLDVAGAKINTGGGTWLLDPFNIDISTSAASNAGANPNFDATAVGAIVNNTDITNGLSSNDVRVTTTDGDITVSSPISWATTYGLGIYAGGNIAVNANITDSANGNITLVSGWDGNTGTPGVSGSGGIGINSASITTGGLGVVLLKTGTTGISATGTGTGSGGAFLQGKVALQSAGPISVSKLDGDFVATSTGSGSAISIGDPGALTVSGTSIGGVAAGVSSTNGNITLEAYGGALTVSGPISAGTGQVKIVTSSGGGYSGNINSTVSGDTIKIYADDVLTIGSSSQINTGSSTTQKVDLAGKNSLAINAVVYGADIRLQSDALIVISSPGTIYSLASSTGSVEFQTYTSGKSIYVGSDTGTPAAGFDLKIDMETSLDRVSAPNVIFGNDHTTYGSGALTVDGITSAKFLATPSAIAFLSKSSGSAAVTLQNIELSSGKVGMVSGTGNITATTGGINASTILAKTGGGAVDLSLNTTAPTVGSITTLVDGTSTTFSGIQSIGGAINITTTNGLTVSSPINTGGGNVSITASGGSITGTGGITGNRVDLNTSASPGTIGVSNTSLATTASILSAAAYGDIYIANSGAVTLGFGSTNPVKSQYGGITIQNTGAITTASSISGYAVDAYGGVTLTATNSPLTVAYGGNVRSQYGSVTLTAGSGGTMTIGGTVAAPTASVTLAAGSLAGIGTVITSGGSVAATSYSYTNNTPSSGGGGGGGDPPPPSIGECTANPTQSGCGSVLPPLDSCVTTPTAPGCSVVLPPIDSCVTNPTAPGCSVVLPPIDSCVTNPTAPGCSVVLPPLDSCVTTPTAPGCSVVLPPIGSCVTNPTAPGCSVVLPPLDSCVTNPSAPGCSVVLPPPTLPTEQQLACYIDPTSCTPGGGTTTGTTSTAVQTVVDKIGVAKQTFTLTSQTGLTQTGTVNLAMLSPNSLGGTSPIPGAAPLPGTSPAPAPAGGAIVPAPGAALPPAGSEGSTPLPGSSPVPGAGSAPGPAPAGAPPTGEPQGGPPPAASDETPPPADKKEEPKPQTADAGTPAQGTPNAPPPKINYCN